MNTYIVAAIAGLVIIGLFRQGLAAQCACATSNVNVRTGPGTSYSKIGLLVAPSCTEYLGVQQSGGSYTWAKVRFNGQTGWIATNWLQFRSCSSSGCPNIVSRSEWGARPSSKPLASMTSIPDKIIIHHTAGSSCTTRSSCITQVKVVQNYHMDSRGYRDLGYSFLIGEDGNVYEGRGWGKIGAHTSGYNDDYGFVVLGNFMNRLPNQAALNALTQLINCAKNTGRVVSNYILKGHRDVGSTACPGTQLYNRIRTWPNYQ